jgi:hypothetical protein
VGDAAQADAAGEDRSRLASAARVRVASPAVTADPGVEEREVDGNPVRREHAAFEVLMAGAVVPQSRPASAR